jgi:hypothetical protein
MLQIDRSNPDVIKSAEKMGIDIGQGTWTDLSGSYF